MRSSIVKRAAPALLVSALAGSAVAAQERTIPVAGLRADVGLAVTTIERSHPDLSHSVRKQDLERTARQIERQITRPMTQAEAWSALARLNPVLADGHLFIGFPDWRAVGAQASGQSAGLFPFEVSIGARNQLSIVSALGGGATPFTGQHIKRINGRPASEVVRKLLALAHGDTPAFRSALLARRWWFFYAESFGTPATFELDLAAAGHRSISASHDKPALLQQEASFARTYRCEITKRGAVLTANSFAWPDKAKFFGFTHDCFARVAAAGVSRLIIDVRQNGGGDDDMWRDGILRYIADRPYKQGSHYLKRVIEPDAGQVAGQVVAGEIESASTPPATEPLRFKGQVFVLVVLSSATS